MELDKLRAYVTFKMKSIFSFWMMSCFYCKKRSMFGSFWTYNMKHFPHYRKELCRECAPTQPEAISIFTKREIFVQLEIDREVRKYIGPPATGTDGVWTELEVEVPFDELPNVVEEKSFSYKQ